MYELDVRSIRHNLLATLARRPEAYHRKVLAGANGQRRRRRPAFTTASSSSSQGSNSGSAIRRPPAQEPAGSFLRQRRHAGRRSPRARRTERGDFLNGAYEARIRRNPDRIQVQLVREGNAWASPLKITKGVTLEAGSSTLEIAYLLEGLPAEQPLHFAVEFNFAGLPVGRRRSLLLRRRRPPAGPTGHAAQPGRHRASWAWSTNGWASTSDLKASRPRSLWTYPDRDRQPIGRRLRAGASIGRRAAALDRAGRRRGPLERDDADGDRHQPGRKPPRATPGGAKQLVIRFRGRAAPLICLGGGRLVRLHPDCHENHEKTQKRIRT